MSNLQYYESQGFSHQEAKDQVAVVECLVFLLKGWSVTLKDKGNGVWIFLRAVCLIYCFAIPVLMLHALIFGQFKHPPGHPMTGLVILSWAGAVILSWLIYRRYSLDTDNAPKLMYWAYWLGRRIAA